MPLSPKHEYSTRIYAELLSSIGARIVQLTGKAVAFGVFSQSARPVGFRDSGRLVRLLGLERSNAASAVLVVRAAAKILDVDVGLLKLDPGSSQAKTTKCLYGEAIFRYRTPFLCAICEEYNRGICDAVGVKFVPHAARVYGEGYCTGTYVAGNAPGARLPGRLRMELMLKLISSLPYRNALVVSTFSTCLIGLGERASKILGAKAALIPARGAFDAGVYQGPIFFRELGLGGGLEDSARLVAAVRNVIGCRVHTSFSGGGFVCVTRNCPHRAACSPGNFIEVACSSYTCGLLSGWGEFKVLSGMPSGVCRQEFSRAVFSRATAGPKSSVAKRRGPGAGMAWSKRLGSGSSACGASSAGGFRARGAGPYRGLGVGRARPERIGRGFGAGCSRPERIGGASSGRLVARRSGTPKMRLARPRGVAQHYKRARGRVVPA